MEAKIKFLKIQCNYATNPVGIDTHPYFSWQLKSDMRGDGQIAYRVRVASSKQSLQNEVYDMWDSGNIYSGENLNIKYEGKTLEPRKRYWWKVSVTNSQKETLQSEINYFETGKLLERWQGKWISPTYIKDEASSYIAPYMRKTFEIEQGIKEARLYICGLGYFEAYIEGEKLSQEMLITPFTKFDSTAFYQIYDVTSHLRQGSNVIGVILGNGWYNCFTEDPWNTRQASWRHYPKLIAELYIEYKDGSKEVICSDSTWKAHPSPILFNGIRNGEYYDAQLEITEWHTHKLDDTSWDEVKVIRGPGGQLKACEMEGIRITQEIQPIKKWQNAQGHWVIDMGQNFSGVAKLRIKGPKGHQVTMRYAEELDETKDRIDQAHIGNFVRSGAFQTDKYIKKSNQVEEWHPRFVYHGFRYVEIEDSLEHEVVGLVMHTDLQHRGVFTSSNPLLNKIQDLCYWSTISNYHSILTDCPHREKNGWTGDVAVSAEQIMWNFAPMRAYTKLLDDIQDSQRNNGMIPCVVPSTGWGYNWGNGPDWSNMINVLPWYMYIYCNDKRILEKYYKCIEKHFEYMCSMAEDNIVSYGIGDWCAPFEGSALAKNMGSFKAPVALTDTACFYYAARLLVKISEILNQDSSYYEEKSEEIKQAFRKHFFNQENFKVAGECQTAIACMMYYDLIEKEERERLGETLIDKIKQQDSHIDYGILGSKYVMHTLGEMNRSDIIYEMITQETYPSFKWWLDRGATTLWECWNGGGSHNHHMFSDISAVLYKYIAGIRPDEDQPGFRHIYINPAVKLDLSYVRCSYESLHGRIQCNWEKEEGKIYLELEIPFGTQATIGLPKEYIGHLTEGHKSIKEVKDISEEITEQMYKLHLGSGSYKLYLIESGLGA